MPASTNPETEAYYLQQAALGAWASQQVGSVALLEPAHLAASVDALAERFLVIAEETSAASIGLAADYYETFREAQGVRPDFRVPVIDPPTPEHILQTLDERTTQLLSAVDVIADEIYLGDLTSQLAAEIDAIAAEITMDAGLEELLNAVHEDYAAQGWARVTREGACSFCRMLAMRGPVYIETTVNFRAHVVRNGRGGVCRCTAEPLIGESYEPTAQARADAALWDRIRDRGLSPAEQRYEFRRLIEGREDGPRGGRHRSERSPRQAQAQKRGFEHMTVAQLERQLAIMAPLKESEWKIAQTARIKARLAELASQ